MGEGVIGDVEVGVVGINVYRKERVFYVGIFGTYVKGLKNTYLDDT